MKDPESIHPTSHGQPDWMTEEDKELFDAIDDTIDDYVAIDSQLKSLIDEIPLYENPIKMLANLRMAYNAYSEEEREVFIKDVIEKANNPETPQSQKGALFNFLSSLDSFDEKKDNDSDLLTS